MSVTDAEKRTPGEIRICHAPACAVCKKDITGVIWWRRVYAREGVEIGPRTASIYATVCDFHMCDDWGFHIDYPSSRQRCHCARWSTLWNRDCGICGRTVVHTRMPGRERVGCCAEHTEMLRPAPLPKQPRQPRVVEATCRGCSNVFATRPYGRYFDRYCSHACRQRAYRAAQTKRSR